MSWQAWFRDLDRVRRQLHEDLGVARRRGRVPVRRRATWWAAIGMVGLLAGASEPAILGIVAFELVLAPRLARFPRRSLERLVPWVPPESWHPSPEAPAPMPRAR
ncbi:MAG: hypothetical protein ACRDKA_08955 [Actinomycetota bacterium]